MRLRIIAALGLLVVGLGAVGVVVLRPGSATTTTQLLTGVASVIDVVEDVAASGTLSASATYGLAFGSEPQLVSGTASTTASGGGRSSSGLAPAQPRRDADSAGPAAADKASAYDQVKQARQNLSQAKSSQANTKAQND